MQSETIARVLAKCQGLSETPEVDCAVAVGIAMALARPMDITVLDIDAIVGYDKAFKIISECNEICVICIDTATRTYSQFYQARMGLIRGHATALKLVPQVSPELLNVIEVLTPIFKSVVDS